MKLKLIKKLDEASKTVSFFWQTDQKVDFTPGQYFYYTLPKLNYADERGDTRHFTISGSPTEGEMLRLTTRIREESGYKKTLNELPIGTEISGRGPQGEFVLESAESNKSPLLFIAGGIGITPYRSMIKYTIDKKQSRPIYLIYSNSDSEFTFRQDLDAWAFKNNWLHINYIDTSKERRIDVLKIKTILHDWDLKIGDFATFLTGPPAFVSGLEEVLQKVGIKEDQLKSEKFSGY